MLQIAAVIGQEVRLDLWSKISSLPDGELAPVLQQVLETRLMEEIPGSGTVGFSHARST